MIDLWAKKIPHRTKSSLNPRVRILNGWELDVSSKNPWLSKELCLSVLKHLLKGYDNAFDLLKYIAPYQQADLQMELRCYCSVCQCNGRAQKHVVSFGKRHGVLCPSLWMCFWARKGCSHLSYRVTGHFFHSHVEQLLRSIVFNLVPHIPAYGEMNPLSLFFCFLLWLCAR